MNLMILALFSKEGGLSKDFLDIARNAAQLCNVYTVVAKNELDSSVPNEKGRLVLEIGRNNVFGFLNPLNYYKVVKAIKTWEIDNIYLFSNTPFNFVLSFLLRKKNLYAFLHNPRPHIGSSKVIYFVENLTNKSVTRFSKKIFVASDYQRRELSHAHFYKNFRNKIESHYLGSQSSLCKGKLNIKKNIDLLFFGRIEYYKGVDILVEAMKSLPNVNCTIIGNGSINIDIPDNVTLINSYVEDEKLIPFLNRSKIGCLPYREATGTAIVQTFSYFSIPVIATNTGCLPEYVMNNKTGIIVEPDNVDQLRGAIKTFVGNPELVEEYGINANKELSRFDNYQLAKELLKKMGEIV